MGQVYVFPTGKGQFLATFRLYRDSDGFLVVEFLAKKSDVPQSLFYDFKQGMLNTAVQGELFANNNDALFDFINAHHLRQLELAYGSLETELGYAVWQGTIDDAPLCQCPYGSYLSMTDPSGHTQSVVLLKKLEQSVRSTREVWCEAGPGEVQLSLKYQPLAPSIYNADRSSFYLVFTYLPYIVRLATNLDIITGENASELFVIPTEIVHRYCRALQENSMPPQEAIDAMEAEIAAIAKNKDSPK
ncbi:MAG TPA: hypothetical protein VJ779_08630 [Acetobacteraceae bacterium]|nr:hypothetical protein [Acetobacteraceae bacterium]